MSRAEIIEILASIIRKVDGNHKLGAGALAEAIVAEVEDIIVCTTMEWVTDNPGRYFKRDAGKQCKETP